jgi:Spy/CpxP family protein refolding chaperone
MRAAFAPLTPAKEARMNMKRTSEALAVALALILAGAAARAEERGATRSWREVADAAKGPGCEGGPLALVAQFLTLAPEQVQALSQLLQQREQAQAPVLQQISVREEQIAALLENGGDPAEIGQLMVEVHQLQGAAHAVQAQFLASLGSLLTEPQRQRWAQVRMAAQLQPVVPAFQALRLF